MFILIGTASQVKAQCPAITINSFSVSTDTICPNGTVSFNVWTTYSNTIAWDFGNGKVSTSRDVSTKYTTPGKYYITCLVSSTCGNDTLLTDSIVVNANIPRFSLNANPSNADSVCPNERTFFNINGDFKSIMWSFDNGHKSDKSYVMEKFATMGDHPYTLILTDHCDNDTTIYGKTVVRITSEFIDDVNISISDSTCKTAHLSYYNNGDLQDVR